MENEKQSADFTELYENFMQIITADSGKPYTMANLPLARAYYEKLKETEPGAFLLCTETAGQFITITDEARKKVADLMTTRAAEYEKFADLSRKYAALAGGNYWPVDPFREYLEHEADYLGIKEEMAEMEEDAEKAHAVAEKKRLLSVIMEAYQKYRDGGDNLEGLGDLPF